MYTTKLFNKQMVDKNAYLCIGDPYKDPKTNPFREPKKGEKNRLKAFEVPQRPVNQQNGFFTKVSYMNDDYKDQNKYIKTQPPENRKNGFGSKDAFKTDEFSNHIRTEQHRQSIRKETAFMGPISNSLKKKLDDLTKRQEEERAAVGMGKENNKYDHKVAQYDIGRDRVTDFNPHKIKDTYYNFDYPGAKDTKRFGSTNRPVSCDIGSGAWDVKYKPPQFGGTSEVKRFSDRSHLNVNTVV